jgi:hypothetical protein
MKTYFVRWIHQAGRDHHGWRDSSQDFASLEDAREALARPFVAGVLYGQLFRREGRVNTLVQRRDRKHDGKCEGEK